MASLRLSASRLTASSREALALRCPASRRIVPYSAAGRCGCSEASLLTHESSGHDLYLAHSTAVGCSPAASHYWRPCAMNCQRVGGRRTLDITRRRPRLAHQPGATRTALGQPMEGTESGKGRMGANGYCCHTADLSLGAESCSETTLDCCAEEYTGGSSRSREPACLLAGLLPASPPGIRR